MSLHILFITTHNLATNPRLLKEIQLAKNAGYKISVVCFEFNNWSKALNDAILQELDSINLIKLQAGRKPLAGWAYSVFTETLCRLMIKAGFRLKGQYLAQAVNRRSLLLLRAIKKVGHADLVVGHNPGALYATWKAAQKFKCRVGFDVEDYHPGEGNDDVLQDTCRKLMQQVLPKMNYVSFAAPLIKQAVKEDIGEEKPSWITIKNYFPAAEFIIPQQLQGSVKMVWFSQNISSGRGLELILPIVKQLKGQVELSIYGHPDPDFYEQAIRGIDNVTVCSPLPVQELHKILSTADIGLALEPSKDRNNELAISNKILAYLQAGLFVLATDTKAQAQVLNENPGAGKIFTANINEAGNAIKDCIANIDQIRAERLKRYRDFNHSWEKESLLLLETWKK